MSDIFDDYVFAKDRRPGRFYISKRFKHGQSNDLRYAHRVFPSEEMPVLYKEEGEIVLLETIHGVQQVKAKFLEDERRITHLWFQRWDTRRDVPIGAQFVIFGEQINRLMEFLEGIKKLHIESEQTFNGDYADLRLVRMDDDAHRFLDENRSLVKEFVENQITTEDIIAIAYRRRQLDVFKSMLQSNDNQEAEWQAFFESNQWIFGYGLTYVFTTGLDGKRLQQTVRGASITHPGKQPDAIMKTRAAISALCLVEIKKSNTALLKKSEYRSGTWAPTAELSGAVAQAQENVRVALEELDVQHSFKDALGNPTGEVLMTVQPRSFLIVGNLNEFLTDHGVNSARYRSFEDYRRNLRQPEIITFDELYERAKFIVDSSDTAPKDETIDIPS